MKINAEPYAFTFNPSQTALIIIDMQRDFLHPGGFGTALGNDVSLLQTTIAPTKAVLSAFRAYELLVVHTREGHDANLIDLPITKQTRGNFNFGIGSHGTMGRMLIRGEFGHEIIPELKPHPHELIIDKPGKGAFYETDLEALLKKRRISYLIICGVTTEVCVHTTLREANDRGFECLVLSDCVSFLFS